MRHCSLLPFFSVVLLFCVPATAQITLAAHKISKDITGAEITALQSSGYESKAGNLIVVWAVSFAGAQPVGLVTDSAGDTFVAASPQKSTWHGQFFYARNVKGDPFNVVTLHPAITGRATFFYVGMNVLEYSGVDKASPLNLDIAGPQGSLDGAWTSAGFTPAPGELVVCGIVTANGGAYTAGPGFKIEDAYLTPTASKFSFGVMDQVISGSPSVMTASAAWKGTLQATGAVVSFKPAK